LPRIPLDSAARFATRVIAIADLEDTKGFSLSHPTASVNFKALDRCRLDRSS